MHPQLGRPHYVTVFGILPPWNYTPDPKPFIRNRLQDSLTPGNPHLYDWLSLPPVILRSAFCNGLGSSPCPRPYVSFRSL